MTDPTATTAAFPQAGITLSRLGFGCASLMRITSACEREALFAASVDAGITHFDTARMYGLGMAEAELGRFARSRRDQITIATKFGLNPPTGRLAALARFQQPARALLNRFPALRRAVKRRGDALVEPVRYDAAAARLSLDTSLQQLGTDHVDLLFLHAPTGRDHVDHASLVPFFEEAKAAGKIRAWGISVEDTADTAILDGLGPTAVLQVRSSVLGRPATDAAHLSFGVIGEPYALLEARLSSSPDRRRAWTESLGFDPLSGGALAALMLSDSLAANPHGTVVYGSNQGRRLATAAQVAREPHDADTLAAFRSLVDAERGALPV